MKHPWQHTSYRLLAVLEGVGLGVLATGLVGGAFLPDATATLAAGLVIIGGLVGGALMAIMVVAVSR